MSATALAGVQPVARVSGRRIRVTCTQCIETANAANREAAAVIEGSPLYELDPHASRRAGNCRTRPIS